MKSLVSINLFRTSKSNVIKFAEDYGVSPEPYLHNKRMGFAIFWMAFDYEKGTATEIAYSKSIREKKPIFNDDFESTYGDRLGEFYKYNPKKGRVYTDTTDSIDSIEDIDLSDIVGDLVVESESLDLDTILDKIGKSGIKSLTKKEVDFLDNVSGK